MYLVLPQDHPLARKRGVRLADLAGEPWIGGAPDCECNRMISQACLRFGFDPRIAFETDDYAADPGLRRRRRRRLADRRARPAHGPRRHRRALRSAATRRCARSTPRR